ncbi:hypothetical protein [Flavisolibacter tropicus]|nr:hypothetical protein [Flavisolibacter tropicus]
MKKVTLSVFMLLAVLFTALSSQAQSKGVKKIDVIGKKVEASRGANPNIKSDVPTTDNPVEKSRGASCSVTFDNYTGLYVKVYVDGTYRGTVDAYGKGTVTVGSGYTTIYCVSTGGTTEWSASGDCRSSYIFNLKYSTAD